MAGKLRIRKCPSCQQLNPGDAEYCNNCFADFGSNNGAW